MRYLVGILTGLLVSVLLFASDAQAVDVGTLPYSQGNGGYYSNTDHSGPYAIGPDGTMYLIGKPPASNTTAAPTAYTVYGPDKPGQAPTQPPVFLAGVDGNGNILGLTSTALGLLVSDTAGDLALGTPSDPAAAVGGNGSVVAQLRQAVNQLSQTVAQLKSTLLVSAAALPLPNGASTAANQTGVNAASPTRTAPVGSSLAADGIVPVTVTASTSVQGKPSQGNLYSAYAVNTTTTAGWLVCVDAAALPGSGTTIVPKDLAYLSGTVGATAQVNFGSGPANVYSNGIECVVSTSQTTYTPGGASFIQVRAR